MTSQSSRHLLQGAGLALVAILAALIVAVSASSTVQHLDHRTISAVHEEAAEHEYYNWNQAARHLGSDSATLAIACMGILLLAAIGRRRSALFVGLALVSTKLGVIALKALVERPRPPGEIASGHAHSFGFPSGHSAAAMAVYGSLALLAANSSRGLARLAILCSAGVVVAAVGGSSVYLGVRYPTDVLAGWLTAGVAILVAWHVVGERSIASLAEAKPAGIGTQPIGLPGRTGTWRPAGPHHSRTWRTTLKRVPGLVPTVYALRRSRRELNALVHGLLGWVGDASAAARTRERFHGQTVVEHRVRGAGEPDLIRQLEAGGIDHDASESSIYIPPRPGLEFALGDLDIYPKDSAFKVMRRDDRADEALLVANLLHLRGLAPRVYDRFELIDGETRRSVFAMQDSGSGSPLPEQRSEALEQISRLIESGALTVEDEGWAQPEHLRADGAGSHTAHYVGFENFRVRNPRDLVMGVLHDQAREDLHYGTEYAIKGGRYLYQSVPSVRATGRRNSRRRWNAIRSMLGQAGVPLEGRVALDVGCNAGMIMAAALSDGALWALGWDFPQVVRHARNLMLVLGYTRFDMFGADLTRDYSLAGDIPPSLHGRFDGSVVFYLAFRHNVGYFLSELGELPWKAIVYEGGEEESVQTLDESLEELHRLCDFSIAAAVDFRDSETGSRPLAVLVRS